MNRPGALAFIGVLCGVLPGSLAAQAGGTLRGRVTDGRGIPVASAAVVVTGSQITTSTDTAGVYRFPGTPPGRYTVRVFAIGYASAVRDDVVVTRDSGATADFTLIPSAVDLPGLVVTASRAPEQVGDAPVSVAVMSREEIQNRNVVGVDEALPYEPGVIFQHGTLDIRGASGIAGGVASRVLLLIDDHPLLTGDTREVDFNSIPVLNIDRVEVVRGPASALYGSNALGGVVNIISRPLSDAPETTVRGYYGAYDLPSGERFTGSVLDLKGLDFQHDQPIGQFGTRLFLERAQSDGFTQNGEASRWMGRAEITYPRGSPMPLELYATWAQETDGNYFIWRDSLAGRYEVPDTEVGDQEKLKWVDVGATIIPYGSPSLLVRFNPYLYYNDVRNEYGTFDFHHATIIGNDAQVVVNPAAEHVLILGVLAENTSIVSNTLGRHTEADFALYGQDEAGLLAHLTATFGARVDHHTVTGGSSETVISPKAGLVFKPGEALSVRASVSHGFRAPAPVEQFVDAVQSGFHVVPDTGLKAERSWAAEVGAATTIGGWLWLDGSIFDDEYYDLINPAPAIGYPFGYFQFRNVERSQVQGLDLETRAGLWGNRIGLHVNYTFLHTRNLATDLPLPYRSTHNVGATATTRAAGVDWGVDVLYRSRIAQVLVYPLDSRTDVAVVGLRAGRQFGGWNLQGKVTNLFQKQYVDIQERTPGAPRRFLVSLTRIF